jgi:rubrerythrin
MPYEDEEDDEEVYDDDEEVYDEDDDSIVLACEECDYRWKLDPEAFDESLLSDEETICPMCGSSSVVEI